MLTGETPAEVFAHVAGVVDPHEVADNDHNALLKRNMVAVTPERAAELCDRNVTDVSLEDTSAGQRVYCYRVGGTHGL